MSLRRVLKFAFHASREEPKILLPAVLNWIPLGLAVVFITFLLSELSLMEVMQPSSEAAAKEAVEQVIASATTPEGVVTVFVLLSTLVLSSWIIGAFVRLMYIDITRQFDDGRVKHVKISRAFYRAKDNLIPVLWIHLIEIAIGSGVSIVTLVLMMVFVVFFPPIVPLLLFAWMGAIVYLSLKFWLSEVVLVTEEEYGLDALKRSFHVTEGQLIRIVVLLVVVGAVTGIVNNALMAVPVAGFGIALLLGLFFQTWTHTVPPAFYYQYELSKK